MMGKPTERMIRFAHKIGWGLGMEAVPPEVETDFDSCSKFIAENKGEFYRRNYEHDKWLRDMESNHRTSKYVSEYNMPYAEGVAASDYGIFPWGNS